MTFSMKIDHDLKIDGIAFRQVQEITNQGAMSTLIRTRYIEDDEFEYKRVTIHGAIYEETVKTDMDDSKFQMFQRKWSDNWKPTLTEHDAGANLLKYCTGGN